jgi:hypothetical protein
MLLIAIILFAFALQMVSVVVLASLLGAVLATHVPHHQEAPEGTLVTLPCLSTSDGEHQFQFWMLDDDTVIGPKNPGDRNKYKYEVLSGNLSITVIFHLSS